MNRDDDQTLIDIPLQRSFEETQVVNQLKIDPAIDRAKVICILFGCTFMLITLHNVWEMITLP